MVGILNAGNVEEIVIRTIYDDTGAKKGLNTTTTQVKKLGNGMENVTKVTKNASGQFVNMTKQTRKSQEQFSMWALSFIFAGMQIKMVAQQIARSTTATFLKIEQGQTDAGRSLIGLAANFKFLQFQIGQAIGTALKPLMPILTSIIRSVAQFVAQNPGKTFAAIAAAFTLGTGMFLGGQMVLFADALVALIDKGGGLTKVMAPLAFLANPVVIGSLLALVALSRVTWKSFSETPEAWQALKDSMSVLGGEDGPLENIGDSMERLIQTIFPDFQLSWENIAWTVAWAGKIIVNQVAAITEGLSMMANLAAIAINSMMGIRAALLGNEEEAMRRQRAVDDAREAITGSATNLRSMTSSQAGLLAQGPMGFKEDSLREQNGRNESARNFLEGGPQLLINANVVNMGSDGSVRGTGNDSLISRTT